MDLTDDLTVKWEYKPATVYELTIAPDDPRQFADKGDTRLKNAVDHFKDALKNWPCRYHLFCEVTHPQYGQENKHRYARIHWHGIISFESQKDISNWLLTKWHKMTVQARVQVNPYRADVWDDYCRKQKSYLPKWTRIKNCAWVDVYPDTGDDDDVEDDEDVEYYDDPFSS